MFDKIIKNIPFTSFITKEDKDLYNNFFLKNLNNFYTYSWEFIDQIIQETKGIKYYDEKNDVLITIAPDWSSNIPNHIYLPLGKNAIKSVPVLAEKLFEVIKNPIVVKKIYGEENKKFLLNNGFSETPLDDNKEGDDKFPEIIVDVNQIIDSDHIGVKGMQYFNRRIRKVIAKINYRVWIPEEKELENGLADDFKLVVDKWSDEFAYRSTKRGFNFDKIKKDVSGVYYPQFLKSFKYQTFCYITYINSEPVAFTSAYEISENCLAVNGSLCDTSFKGLIQYLYLRLAIKAKSAGYKYLNLGSNDTFSQDQYKSRMGIVAKNYTFSFNYKNPSISS